MAAGLLEQDQMSFVGKRPWHGLGVELKAGATGQQFYQASKLDWEVDLTPISALGKEIPGKFATYRKDTSTPLGVVGSHYRPIQNIEVFNVSDALVEGGGAYETAGSLWNGKRVWSLLKLDNKKVLGDEYESYLFVINSHDGLSGFQAGLTSVRIVCNNTMNAALKSARRVWKIRHFANATARINEAKLALGFVNEYDLAFEAWAEEMAKKPLQIEKFVSQLIPSGEDETSRRAGNLSETRNSIMRLAQTKDDLQNFKGTAWAAYNAVSDYVSNRAPLRNTGSIKSKKMEKFMFGDELLIKAQGILQEVV